MSVFIVIVHKLSEEIWGSKEGVGRVKELRLYKRVDRVFSIGN